MIALPAVTAGDFFQMLVIILDQLVHSALCCAVPPESRQRRHCRLQGRCQKRPEAQEEAGREEREGGVQEGARRRR